MRKTLDTTTDAFQVALRYAVQSALAKYPSEEKRIHKGAQLITDGHVELLHDQHIARIRSSRFPSVTYTCNGQCECQGFRYLANGHCSHRFAKSLYKKALKNLEHMWYAMFIDSHGIAVHNDTGYVFYRFDGVTVEIAIDSPSLVLLGRCDMVLMAEYPELDAYEASLKSGIQACA